MYGVLPASSPCLQQAPGCVPSPEQAGETFSARIHAGSAGSRAPLPAGKGTRRCESKQRKFKPSQVLPTPPETHLLNRLHVSERKSCRDSAIPSEPPKITRVQCTPLPPKAQTHPHRLLSPQSLDTTIHPETRVIYREICCQQLVKKAEPKTPLGSGMLRHIFKWMSCGKAYCIL